MLREKPPISDAAIALCLDHAYGLTIDTITFLPIGYDPNAAVYRIDTRNAYSYFLKLTHNAIAPASLQVPRVLIDHGIANVLAPSRTLCDELWCALEPYSLILYPFIHGANATEQEMSDQQWTTFGATLSAIHRSGIEAQFVGQIPLETFATPMIGLVRAMQERIQNERFALPVQQTFAAFWQQHAAVIKRLTDRAEQLGTALQAGQFDLVLCHGDIHAANIMLDRNGQLLIVDWDTLRIAPPECDLLFIVGSMIAHRVTPHEEACFFGGYGATDINWRALTYYRYERALEDIYEGGRSVFLNPLSSVAVKEADAELTMGLFQPGDLVEWAFEADKRLDD